VDVVILELEGVEWSVVAESLLDMVGGLKREEGKRATHRKQTAEHVNAMATSPSIVERAPFETIETSRTKECMACRLH
jgi:hypothetical protein